MLKLNLKTKAKRKVRLINKIFIKIKIKKYILNYAFVSVVCDFGFVKYCFNFK